MYKCEGDIICDDMGEHSGVQPKARGRVLLAEDDEELRWLIASALRKDGFDVIEVENGLALLDQVGFALLDSLELDSIDLIISDIRMPGWSGLEVLAGLASAGCRTPVVLMTAFGDAETHAAAKRLGAAAVLDKPFDIEDFRSVVLRTLEPKNGHRVRAAI